MTWQDLVLSTAGGVMTISLFQMAYNHTTKIPRSSSVPYAAMMTIIGVTYQTLDLYWTALGSYVCSAIWVWIVWRRAK